MRDLEPSQFVGVYEGICSTLSSAILDYLKDPNVEHTHNLRVAVRRFRVATDIVPKGAQGGTLRRSRRRCKKLLNLTSRIRDVDIVRGRLTQRDADGAIPRALKDLEQEREACVSESMNVALRLFDSPSPRLSVRDVPKIGKSLRKALKGLDESVTNSLPSIASNEKLVAELHLVRRELRRLRYLLELLPKDRRTTRACAALRKWQDILGEIRDGDVVLEYLAHVKPSERIRKLSAAEREARHARYRGFTAAYSARSRRWRTASREQSALVLLTGQRI